MALFREKETGIYASLIVFFNPNYTVRASLAEYEMIVLEYNE